MIADITGIYEAEAGIFEEGLCQSIDFIFHGSLG
jgi:hypothetical protein